MLTNIREQHPVGQGFFHSGMLLDGRNGDASRLCYVYDCGSMPTWGSSRVAEIARFRAGNNGKLDLLFLSHIHDDHVNGVPALLAGATVDTIVMPLMSIIERLYVFAMSVSKGASRTGLHADLAVDPAAALERFSPRQIIFFRRSDGELDDGAPGGDDPPVPRADMPTGPDGEIGWKIVGTGRATFGKPDDGSADSNIQNTQTVTLDDVNALSVSTRDGLRWLFAAYIQRAFDNDMFVDHLAAELTLSPHELRGRLRFTAYRRMLITSQVNALKVAYKAVAGKDFNVTSMSLYSGPAGFPNSSSATCRPEYRIDAWGGKHFEYNMDSRCGWLGTGDANLSDDDLLDGFIRHFSGLLNNVRTLTVPHHGSRHDSTQSLYDRVKPAFCVCAADRNSNWHHPGAYVVQAIASAGAILVLATGNSATRFVEINVFP